jgi:hypothetical protein
MSAFVTYWRAYGGWPALLMSPYLSLSGVVWALLKPLWYDGFEEGRYTWVQFTFSIIPALMSFSLGALAVFLALSNERFLKIIRQGGRSDSFLMKVVAAFAHFIIIQFLAILLAVFLVAYPSTFLSGLSFFVLCYALACGVAAVAALVDIAEVLNSSGKLD